MAADATRHGEVMEGGCARLFRKAKRGGEKKDRQTDRIGKDAPRNRFFRTLTLTLTLTLILLLVLFLSYFTQSYPPLLRLSLVWVLATHVTRKRTLLKYVNYTFFLYRLYIIRRPYCTFSKST